MINQDNANENIMDNEFVKWIKEVSFYDGGDVWIAWRGWNARQPEIDALKAKNTALQEQLDLCEGTLDSRNRNIEDMAEVIKSLKEDNKHLSENLEAISTEANTLEEENGRLEDELVRIEAENERLCSQLEHRELSVEEQVARAKENNPDLVHWESNDEKAWDEAMKQDEILRTTSTWANKPFAARFAEVVRRVRAILPEASTPP